MSDTRDTVSIRFGALSPPLREQLAGFGLPEETVGRFQVDGDAITRCHVRGLLADREVDRARQRLLKRIILAIRKARRELKP